MADDSRDKDDSAAVSFVRAAKALFNYDRAARVALPCERPARLDSTRPTAPMTSVVSASRLYLIAAIGSAEGAATAPSLSALVPRASDGAISDALPVGRVTPFRERPLQVRQPSARSVPSGRVPRPEVYLHPPCSACLRAPAS